MGVLETCRLFEYGFDLNTGWDTYRRNRENEDYIEEQLAYLTKAVDRAIRYDASESTKEVSIE